MISYVTNSTETTSHTVVYDADGKGYHLEAVSAPPDFTAQDTIEEEILEALDKGEKVNIKDLAVALVSKARIEIMGEILLRLLCIFSEEENLKLCIDILISAAGLPLKDEPDSAIAARYAISRQNFSIKKKQLLKKLNLPPPPSSKSLEACKSYRRSNRRNGNV